MERERRVGIKDVARRAGVSLSSVSRVLDGHPDVSEAMREQVLESVRALGYSPNPLARSLRTGTTKTVGFVAGDTSNPLIAQIGAAAQLRLRDAGYSLLVANSGNDLPQESTNIALLLDRKVDGLLLSLADESAPGLAERLTRAATPIVLIDRELADSPTVSAVYSDHRAGVLEASQHLLRLGHRYVALINGSPRVRPSRERAEALRSVFAEVAGTEVNVSSGAFSDSHGYDAAMSFLQRRRRPTAVIAGSNQILVGVLRAVRDLGLSVPQDLSLIACDDSPVAELHQPRIACISRDAQAMGVAAADLLLSRFGSGAADIRTLPTRFEPAPSCGPLDEG